MIRIRIRRQDGPDKASRWEEFDVPYTSLADSVVKAGKLRDHWDVILVPDMSLRAIRDGVSSESIPVRYAGGLGTAGIDTLRRFAEAGGTLLDTAAGYGDGASEELLGSLLGDVVRRDDVVIATKAGISRSRGVRETNASRGYLLSTLDGSLRRLGVDHVDLWQVHTWVDDTPLEETLSALDFALTTGRASYVGVSNYTGWQSAKAATWQAAVPGREGGYYLGPTIIDRVTPDMRIAQEEIFGPVTCVIPFSTLDEAIDWNNEVPQGLSSAIFTTNLKSAEAFLSASGRLYT